MNFAKMKSKLFELDPAKKLRIADIREIIENELKIKLSKNAQKNIADCRSYLDKKIKDSKAPIYGINTGFGSLCNVAIKPTELEKLQENLVKSHACGTGELVPEPIARLMMLLKIQAFTYGKSAIHPETVERLVFLFNNQITPVIYQQGSLGASGDLAPLAHMSLPLLGLGEVWYKGKLVSGEEINKKFKLKPIRLKSKEGLALLNGTQFMSAYGIWCAMEARKINESADLIGALSLDAFDGRIEPFSELIQTIRPHPGQLETAANIRSYLKGSELIVRKKTAVQDPYSFRCMPQVHGASKDVCRYAEQVFETEINSVTDNPTVFPDEDEIISGGNFHGQTLAMTLDFLSISISELANISERRTYQLISGQRGLPPFLAANPGLNSGLMIPQYTAAGIVSQNKQLCTPSSADSIVSSNGQEDHVSMGANAATKCARIVENTFTVLGIELLNAAQAIEFRKPLKTSGILRDLLKHYREIVPFIKEDRVLHDDIIHSTQFVKSIHF